MYSIYMYSVIKFFFNIKVAFDNLNCFSYLHLLNYIRLLNYYNLFVTCYSQKDLPQMDLLWHLCQLHFTYEKSQRRKWEVFMCLHCIRFRLQGNVTMSVVYKSILSTSRKALSRCTVHFDLTTFATLQLDTLSIAKYCIENPALQTTRYMSTPRKSYFYRSTTLSVVMPYHCIKRQYVID